MKKNFEMGNYFYSVSEFYKKFFREKIWKISLDLGIPCVHGKCIYCNETSFIPSNVRGRKIRTQIEEGISILGKRYGVKKFIAYLQSGTNTAVSPEVLEKVLEEIFSYKEIVSLSIGTRPDYISQEVVELFKYFSKYKPIFVELGLQSANDDTLKFINRGHTFSDFQLALQKLLECKNLLVVAHMIVGLPGEDKDVIFKSFEKVSHLPLNGVKIHHLQVVKNTPLERIYLSGRVKIFEEVEDYIEILSQLLEILPPHFVIHRLYGDIPHNLLIAPRWKIDKNSFKLKLEEKFKERDGYQGKYFKR